MYAAHRHLCMLVAVTLTSGGHSATALMPKGWLERFSGRVCDVPGLLRGYLPGVLGSMEYKVSYGRENAFGAIVATQEVRDYSELLGTDFTFALVFTPTGGPDAPDDVVPTLHELKIDCRIQYAGLKGVSPRDFTVLYQVFSAIRPSSGDAGLMSRVCVRCDTGHHVQTVDPSQAVWRHGRTCSSGCKRVQDRHIHHSSVVLLLRRSEGGCGVLLCDLYSRSGDGRRRRTDGVWVRCVVSASHQAARVGTCHRSTCRPSGVRAVSPAG